MNNKDYFIQLQQYFKEADEKMWDISKLEIFYVLFSSVFFITIITMIVLGTIYASRL